MVRYRYMTNTLSAHKAGLALGGLLGSLHLLWSLLVAAGWAEPLMDIVFGLHMIQPVFIVEAFSLPMAISLVVVTSLIGYLVGFAFASIWNAIQKK